MAAGFVAALLLVNLFSLWATRTRGVRGLRIVAVVETVIDSGLTYTIVLLFTFDPHSSLWALLIIPVLEGATRGSLAGALWAWAAVSLGYLGREVWGVHAYDCREFGLDGHDALTGLPNRARFLERLASVLEPTDGPSSAVAVLFIDLDGLKAVNDELGHAAGDELLTVAGARLRNVVRSQDLVARIGGDEFTVLLPGGGDRHLHHDEIPGTVRTITARDPRGQPGDPSPDAPTSAAVPSRLHGASSPRSSRVEVTGP